MLKFLQIFFSVISTFLSVFFFYFFLVHTFMLNIIHIYFYIYLIVYVDVRQWYKTLTVRRYVKIELHYLTILHDIISAIWYSIQMSSFSSIVQIVCVEHNIYIYIGTPVIYHDSMTDIPFYVLRTDGRDDRPPVKSGKHKSHIVSRTRLVVVRLLWKRGWAKTAIRRKCHRYIISNDRRRENE